MARLIDQQKEEESMGQGRWVAECEGAAKIAVRPPAEMKSPPAIPISRLLSVHMTMPHVSRI